MNVTRETISPTAKPKRIRRWAKRPANPNDVFPNTSLSVRDVHLLVRVLNDHAERIAPFKDRASKTARRHAQKLVDKLHQVRWSP